MLTFGKRMARRALPAPVRRMIRGQRRAAAKPVEGLPDGIDFERLDGLCRERLDQPLQHAAHVHLSGWKTSGAYRLLLKTERGRVWSVIYKNAIYNDEHIPVVRGLPVMPGPPEFGVYSQAHGALTAYLPEIYLCHEVTPGEHYRYLMEDLNTGYRRMADRPEEIYAVTDDLPALHRVMQTWAQSLPGDDHLLRYGPAFSAALLDYARAQISRYVAASAGGAVSQLWERWDAITAAHQRPDLLAMQQLQPIHGDYSPANICIHLQQPERYKILDWEWAGWGTSHADLAALLKRLPDEVEQAALARYIERDERFSPAEHRQLYEWGQLERGMMDVAYLAKQQLDSADSASVIPAYIERSALRSLQAFERLS